MIPGSTSRRASAPPLSRKRRYGGRGEPLTARYAQTPGDCYVEIPVFVVVLGTALMMRDAARLSGWYLVKVVCGLVAVGANVICVVPVVLRRRAAERDSLADVRRYSRMIDWTGVVGIPAAMVALGIGASGVA